MSFGRVKEEPPPLEGTFATEDEGFANSQRAIPIPVAFGKRKFKTNWITEILSQKAVESEREARSKK